MPAQRQTAVRTAFAIYAKRRDLSEGIVSPLKVPNSRGDGRQLRDRLRRLGKPRRQHEAKDVEAQSLELTNIGLGSRAGAATSSSTNTVSPARLPSARRSCSPP